MGSIGPTATQTMKRIPRIKFPKRHPQPQSSGSGSASQPLATSASATEGTFFSKSNVSTSMGGKASLQPKRTPVSEEEIEAILMGGTF